jgi:hypothetical protein
MGDWEIESPRRKGSGTKRGYDCFISLAPVEDHYFIGGGTDISDSVRAGGVVRERPNARGKGWIAGVRCGVWSALLAPSTVSTSPNRRFCRRTYHFSSVPLTQARLFATSTPASRSTPFVVYARGVYARNCLSPAFLSRRVLLFITVTHAPILLPTLPRSMFSLPDDSFD